MKINSGETHPPPCHFSLVLEGRCSDGWWSVELPLCLRTSLSLTNLSDVAVGRKVTGAWFSCSRERNTTGVSHVGRQARTRDPRMPFHSVGRLVPASISLQLCPCPFLQRTKERD